MPDATYPTALADPAPGLTCRCPRCGKGKLFQGFLTLRPRCEACGLDYAFADSGDGPAVFIILLAGFIVVGCALIVEFMYQPPFWLHALLWLPLILAVDAAAAAPDEGPDDRAAISSQGRRRPAEFGREPMTAARRRSGLLRPAASSRSRAWSSCSGSAPGSSSARPGRKP